MVIKGEERERERERLTSMKIGFSWSKQTMKKKKKKSWRLCQTKFVTLNFQKKKKKSKFPKNFNSNSSFFSTTKSLIKVSSPKTDKSSIINISEIFYKHFQSWHLLQGMITQNFLLLSCSFHWNIFKFGFPAKIIAAKIFGAKIFS
jgi:hypothetical protein